MTKLTNQYVHLMVWITVSVCCNFRDILPFTLKLPEAIASAKTQKELEEVAQLGPGGSDSTFNVPH